MKLGWKDWLTLRLPIFGKLCQLVALTRGMLAKVADNYDERVDRTVTGLTALIEPILIVFLAVMVGSIVIAMFLPLIRLMQGGFDDHGGGAV